jgi:hypothetical protein
MEKQKKYGKLSQEQLRKFYAYHYQYIQAVDSQLKGDLLDEKIIDLLLSQGGAWGQLYTLSHIDVVAVYMVVVGMSEELHSAAISDDPQEEVLRYLENEWSPESWRPKGLTKENEAIPVSLFFAIKGNLDAICMYGVTLNKLVERVTNGDEDALFKAVAVDRAVLQAEPIAQRVCRAQITDDSSFFDQLAKSITRTKPRRPKIELDDIRFITALLDDSGALSQLSEKELEALFLDDLELYPRDRKDPAEALKKLITKVKQIRGK